MASKPMICFLVLALPLLFTSATSQTPPTPRSYINHTVGDAAGWFFNVDTKKSSTDYSAWASNQTFYLGDLLIFNTNTNQTVYQTYNQTTYKKCTIDDGDNETFQYQGGSNAFGQAMTIVVPLTIEGQQYYFSDANDGIQCRHGMAFSIKVAHGLGLPPSLNQPPPPPYVPPPTPVEADSPPIIVAASPPSGSISKVPSSLWELSLLIVLALLFL